MEAKTLMRQEPANDPKALVELVGGLVGWLSGWVETRRSRRGSTRKRLTALAMPSQDARLHS